MCVPAATLCRNEFELSFTANWVYFDEFCTIEFAANDNFNLPSLEVLKSYYQRVSANRKSSICDYDVFHGVIVQMCLALPVLMMFLFCFFIFIYLFIMLVLHGESWHDSPLHGLCIIFLVMFTSLCFADYGTQSVSNLIYAYASSLKNLAVRTFP